MTHDDVLSRRLRLRLLSREALLATEASRVDEAALLLGLMLPPEWAGVARLACRRLRQLSETPAYRAWSIRAIALKDTGQVVGYVNFHGLPAAHEMAGRELCAEFGYSIFAEWRRRGYAEEMVRALMGWARAHGARHFIFSIAPTNAASQGLARKIGARPIGIQMDEEDGPEDVFLLE